MRHKSELVKIFALSHLSYDIQLTEQIVLQLNLIAKFEKNQKFLPFRVFAIDLI